ncbi:MAG: DUF2125 domain-containing protein, partial [Notoacmeibacter sp.]
LNLRTAAQIYAPEHLIGEIASPLTVSIKDQGEFKLDFETAISSLVGLGGLPERVSLEVQNPGLAQTSPNNLEIGEASLFDLYLRQGQNNQVDLASKLETASLKDAPVFNLSADLAISGATRFDAAIKTNGRLIALLRGNEGEVRSLNFSFVDGGELNLSGPFAISPAGLLSATFKVEADKVDRLIDGLGQISLALGGKALNLSPLKAMALAGKINLTILIKDGDAAMGFIPLGKIPPL